NKSGNLAGLTVDSSGYLQVNVAAGGAGGGAITAASGSYSSGALATGSMVDLLTFQGTKAAGTAAANSLLAGSVYNSSPLTLTTTQQASLQADANGYLKVNVAAGGAGGGAATLAVGSVSAGAYVSGSILSGALAQGAVVDITNGTDTAYAGSGSTSMDGYLKGLYTALGTLNTTAGSAIVGLSGSAQSSSNPMGYVNINQTTPGTTNAVAIDQTTPG